jgi:hypothetical protein
MMGLSDDNRPNSTVCALVKQAMALEKNYKGMLHQGHEVDHRIRLWREALDICNVDFKSTQSPGISRI